MRSQTGPRLYDLLTNCGHSAAMFAKFPNLPGTEKAGLPDAKDAAGHGARALDWHSLRSRLNAERDLRGSLSGENEALACWMRAEGSFDPRAAEALCGHNGDRVQQGAADGQPGANMQEDAKNSECDAARLPDPKPSQPISDGGCSKPVDGGGLASGTSVED